MNLEPAPPTRSRPNTPMQINILKGIRKKKKEKQSSLPPFSPHVLDLSIFCLSRDNDPNLVSHLKNPGIP